MWSTLDPRMMFSSRHGWAEVRCEHAPPRRLFLGLVLPFSLIPALMLAYAGYAHGDVLVPGSTPLQWQIAAAVFLAAELLTVPLMARLLHAMLGGVLPTADQCYALAAYAAVPLWLSSLGLFSSSLLVVGLLAVAGLCAAFTTLFHGMAACFDAQADTLVSQYYAYAVLAAGVCAWLLLIAILAALLGIFSIG